LRQSARRDLLEPGRPGTARVRELLHRPLAVVFEDTSLREAADHMLQEEVGRLPVVTRAEPRKAIGILTRSDLLAAHRRRLDETHVAEQSLSWPTRSGGRSPGRLPRVPG
jgi:signal-transduction protein with cAMP-binding, CBS, and nucleotidyltransferase domain